MGRLTFGRGQSPPTGNTSPFRHQQVTVALPVLVKSQGQRTIQSIFVNSDLDSCYDALSNCQEATETMASRSEVNFSWSQAHAIVDAPIDTKLHYGAKIRGQVCRPRPDLAFVHLYSSHSTTSSFFRVHSLPFKQFLQSEPLLVQLLA